MANVPMMNMTATYEVTAPSDLARVLAKNDFERLVLDLKSVLGPSSGLDSKDVDLPALMSLMNTYQSKESDWSKFALGDNSRNYTRNLVDEGNGKSNLLILVWTPGKGSPIHDHANAHCLMKVLSGKLKEQIFEPPTAESVGTPLRLQKETYYSAGLVTYMADEIGLHRITNASDTEVAVSLHLYTPPNAAKFGVNSFDEKTGKSVHVSQNNFFSVQGVKI